MIQEQLQDRFRRVLDIVQQRFGDVQECDQSGSVLPWDLVRALDSLPTDESFLAWVRRTSKRELVPIVCGFGEVISGLESADDTADWIARRAMQENLPRAAGLFARHWLDLHPRFGPESDSWGHLPRH